MSMQWIKALARADVPEDDVIAVEAGGREIAFYGVDGEVYATDNLCTHGNARLCDGFLTGHEIGVQTARRKASLAAAIPMAAVTVTTEP
jgi:naphthalene 1,2-dioxygenase system ferredoxin subunit